MRLVTTLLACIVSGSVYGQTLVKEMNGADTRFIPGQYMKNGQAAIYFSTDEYGYSDDGQSNTEARIFDFELNPLKTFNFRILHPYNVYERRASTGNIKKTKVITENRNYISGLPPVSDMEVRKTAFVNWYFDSQKDLDPSLSLDNLIANSRIEGNKVFIKLNIDPNGYYGDYSFQEYLTSLETFFDASDSWGFSYTYSTQVPRCNGEWTTTTWYDVPVINFCTPKCVDVASVNYWNGGLYLPFSQTFFNDDEKF